MTNPKIQLRHDTKSNWEQQNPLLLIGEVGIETDTGRTKTGDGTTLYNNLPYDLQGELDKKENKLTAITPINIEDKTQAPTEKWNINIANNSISPEGDSSTFPIYHTLLSESIVPPNTNQYCRNFQIFTNRDNAWDSTNSKPTAYISIPIKLSDTDNNLYNTVAFQHYIGSTSFRCCLPAFLGYWEGEKFITTLLITDVIAGSSSSNQTSSWLYGNPNGLTFNIEQNDSTTNRLIPTNSTFCIQETAGLKFGSLSAQEYSIPTDMAFLQIGIIENTRGMLNLQLIQRIDSNTFIKCACTWDNNNSDFVSAIQKITHLLYVSNEASLYTLNTFASFEDTPRLGWTKTMEENQRGDYQFTHFPNKFDLSKLEVNHNIYLNYDSNTLGLTDGKLTVINGDIGGTLQTQINGLQTQISENSNAISANTENIANLSTGKANIDADNFSTVGKNNLAKIGYPSLKKTDFLILPSGTKYTAPATGYMWVVGNGSTPNNSFILLSCTGGIDVAYSLPFAGGIRGFLPLNKGDTFTITYSNISNWDRASFFWANGVSEESEE